MAYIVMIPGVAKSREELPWLPYPERDRVIINAHNFASGSWTPAVNGKTPIAAWVPSRDVVGNGTTTLYDLSGNSRHCSLIGSASWTADANAGGQHCILFSGGLAKVTHGATFGVAASMSLWVLKTTNLSQSGSWSISTSVNSAHYTWSDTRVYEWAFRSSRLKLPTIANAAVWRHYVIVSDSSGYYVYLDGVLWSSTAASSLNVDAVWRFGMGGNADSPSGTNYAFLGRLDDIRVFDQSLDATDITALYASGSGRGVQA